MTVIIDILMNVSFFLEGNYISLNSRWFTRVGRTKLIVISCSVREKLACHSSNFASDSNDSSKKIRTSE